MSGLQRLLRKLCSVPGSILCLVNFRMRADCAVSLNWRVLLFGRISVQCVESFDVKVKYIHNYNTSVVARHSP